MKKIQQFSVASSKHDLFEKPFGFCCDIKKQDLKEGYKSKGSSTNFFPNIINSKDGGPNIKFCIDEPSVHASRPLRVPKIKSATAAAVATATKASATTIATKSAAAAAGKAGGATTGTRAGAATATRAGAATTATRAGAATATRAGAATATRAGGAATATRAGGAATATEVTIAPSYLNGTMHCKRCRGPLQWYLEDEIEEARNIINDTRQREYHLEVNENIMVAKKKGMS